MRTVNRAATRRIGDLVQALERRTLLSGAADGLFPGMPGASVDTGLSYTNGTVIADFTRDGIPDLVGLSFTTLAVHPGLGDGQFGAAQYPSVPNFLGWPVSVHGFDLADVNGDGRLDLAVDYSFSSSWNQSRFLAVLTQNEDGAFSWPSTTFSNRFGFPRLIDVDSDGDLDFIESSQWTSQLTIQANDGLGVFTPSGTLDLPNLAGVSRVAVADFDGDGLGDLLLGGLQIDVLRRHSDGTYSLGSSIPLHGYSVEVADVNSDGLPDLVTPTAALGWNDVSVIKNLGGWSFAPATLQALVPGPITSLSVGDFDQDGQLDLASAFTTTNGVIGYLAVHRSFTSPQPPAPLFYEMGGIQSATYDAIITQDLNQDGYTDLVLNGVLINQRRAAVFLNMRDGFFEAPASVTTSTGAATTATADLNADGLPEVISVHPASRSITVHRNLGRGSFEYWSGFGIPGTPVATLPTGSTNPRVSILTVDLNDDSRLDLLVTYEGLDRATMILNAGGGLFAQSTIMLGAAVRVLQFADHDRDGRGDLLIDSVLGRQSWQRGLGQATFAAPRSLSTANRTNSFFRDLNGDGVLDIVSQSPSWPNRFAMQLGQPDGSFAPPMDQDLSVSLPPTGLEGWLVDVDSDGDLDLTGWNGGSLIVQQNRGDATFDPYYITGIAPSGTSTGAITHFNSADLDGDGQADLVGVTGAHAIVLKALGGGLFDVPAWVEFRTSLTSAAAVTDVDGDTELDIVVGRDGAFTFLRNLRDAAPPNAVTLNPADDTGVWGDDQITRAETIRFAVTHDDPTARIELRRNGQLIAVRTGSGELVDENVPAGTHAYTALAVVGSRESRPTASLTVTIDRTAPAAPSAPVLQASSDSGFSNADRITNVTAPTFDIASTDSFYRAFVNGVQVGGDYLTGPFTAPALPEGVHTVSIRAVDAAGNVSEAGADVTITIDTTAPTVAQSTFVFEVGHVLEFLFNDLVTGAPTTGHLTVTNLTTGAVVPSSLSFLNSLATFSFPQFASGLLREGNYRTTLTVPNLTDRAGNVGTASATLDFHVLTADINRNRIVDFADLLAVAQNYGQFGRTFSQGNVDYSGDGFVGFNDLLTLAQSYGRSLLVAPAPEASSRVGIFSRSKRRIGEELAESLG